MKVFDSCHVDARGSTFKQTAIAFEECPDELARWLVANGADLSAPDAFGETPLHSRARSSDGRIGVLIELGADVNHGAEGRGAPLHWAAKFGCVDNVKLLIRAGADIEARNADGQTPLAFALARCRNIDIAGADAVAEVLLAAGARATPQMSDDVARVGAEFEFHRSDFDPESVDEASAALDRLYRRFGATPAPRRQTHDGKADIVAKSHDWREQHQELWEALVPSAGAAATVQGEVIRASGRIHTEWAHNGGVNWDADFRKMAKALIQNLRSGNALSEQKLQEASVIIADVKSPRGDTADLCRLAVEWVALNPSPIRLDEPGYKR